MLEALFENEGHAFGVGSPEEGETREELEYWRSQTSETWNGPLGLGESNLDELIESMRELREGLMDDGDTSEIEAIDRMAEDLNASRGKTPVQIIAEAVTKERKK
ncbi:hypothetical protein ACFW31_03360 [Nocardiopsis alba]|uniref:hypothetical protein n=1 Tax=Nocardiopsis alba TaxID=53437 RepID=UPI00366D6AD3